MDGRYLLLLLLLMPVASASHNRFDPFVDLSNINWFDRELYFRSLEFQPCIDLQEFNAYADSDPYDRWDRYDIERHTDRLDWQDLQRVAARNNADYLEGDEFDDAKDFRCTHDQNFHRFARQNRADQWDRDDFFELQGFADEQQFLVRTRHFPYETHRIRHARYGGFSSRYPLTY